MILRGETYPPGSPSSCFVQPIESVYGKRGDDMSLMSKENRVPHASQHSAMKPETQLYTGAAQAVVSIRIRKTNYIDFTRTSAVTYPMTE